MSEGVWCVGEGCSSNLLFSVCSGCDGKRQCVCVANVAFGSIPPSLWGSFRARNPLSCACLDKKRKKDLVKVPPLLAQF